MIVEVGEIVCGAAQRRADFRRRHAPTYHAVTPNCRIALCATEPGARSGWAEPPSTTVTCRVCLEKLARLRGGGKRRQLYP